MFNGTNRSCSPQVPQMKPVKPVRKALVYLSLLTTYNFMFGEEIMSVIKRHLDDAISDFSAIPNIRY